MQKLTALGIILMFAGISLVNAQETNEKAVKDKYQYGAKMRATDGVSWYVFADPLKDYEVLETFELTFPKDHTRSLHLKMVRSLMGHKSLLLKDKYDTVDGIVTKDGETMKVIRYTNDKERHKQIANVQTINGKQVYCWGRPLKTAKKAFYLPYDGDLMLKQDFLKTKMKSLVKKAKTMAEEKDKTFDGLVIREGQVKAIRYFEP